MLAVLSAAGAAALATVPSDAIALTVAGGGNAATDDPIARSAGSRPAPWRSLPEVVRERFYSRLHAILAGEDRATNSPT